MRDKGHWYSQYHLITQFQRSSELTPRSLPPKAVFSSKGRTLQDSELIGCSIPHFWACQVLYCFTPAGNCIHQTAFLHACYPFKPKNLRIIFFSSPLNCCLTQA